MAVERRGAAIEIIGLRKEYSSGPDRVVALDDITLRIAPGEFVCIVGPSGCGKSTLLRILAGLTAQTSGTIKVEATGWAVENAMVFQESGLFPWMSVEANVGFGLMTRGIPTDEAAARVEAALKLVGLTRFRRHYPQLIAALFPIPKIALMPLLLLAFGFGDASKIALVAIAVFFPVVVNTYVGAANIETIYWDVAKNYGASQTVMFTRIVFFGALPTIFAGLRIALAVSFIVLVAAEFVATKAGIGYLIWNSWELLQVDVMFVGIVTIGILGLISSALFQEIERKVVPWKAE